ncbi:Peptidase A22B, signal peptide peptidase [Dillenia turbinata]|uniref:Peptidase A22B, signal peptide peptidase n=1 Tax=Dillenia turbinata TaxID=194707 RepID=A0AAN8YT81_9MAGN
MEEEILNTRTTAPALDPACTGMDVAALQSASEPCSSLMPEHCLLSTTEGFDKANKKGMSDGYFLWLIIGYGFGLFVTYLGLYMMDGHGQPALLYLVPCTLGVVFTLGWRRGEVKDLWNYKTAPPSLGQLGSQA